MTINTAYKEWVAETDETILVLDKADTSVAGKVTLDDVSANLNEYKRLFKAGIASPAEIVTLSRAYPEISKYANVVEILDLTGENEPVVVGGPASVELVDREGHLITSDALEGAFQRYMDNFRTRNVMVMHSDVQVGHALPAYISKSGQIFKSGVNGAGLFFVAELRNDTKIAKKVGEQINSGKMKSYSIAGSATKTQNITKGANSYMQVDQMELAEVTICEKGVNQGAHFELMKSIPTPTKPVEDDTMYVISKNDVPTMKEIFDAWVGKAESKGLLAGKQMAVLENGAARQMHHRSLLDEMGFPHEVKVKDLYHPVDYDDPKNPTDWRVVNQSGQELGDPNLELIKTASVILDDPKRMTGVAKGKKVEKILPFLGALASGVGKKIVTDQLQNSREDVDKASTNIMPPTKNVKFTERTIKDPQPSDRARINPSETRQSTGPRGFRADVPNRKPLNLGARQPQPDKPKNIDRTTIRGQQAHPGVEEVDEGDYTATYTDGGNRMTRRTNALSEGADRVKPSKYAKDKQGTWRMENMQKVAEETIKDPAGLRNIGKDVEKILPTVAAGMALANRAGKKQEVAKGGGATALATQHNNPDRNRRMVQNGYWESILIGDDLEKGIGDVARAVGSKLGVGGGAKKPSLATPSGSFSTREGPNVGVGPKPKPQSDSFQTGSGAAAERSKSPSTTSSTSTPSTGSGGIITPGSPGPSGTPTPGAKIERPSGIFSKPDSGPSPTSQKVGGRGTTTQDAPTPRPKNVSYSSPRSGGGIYGKKPMSQAGAGAEPTAQFGSPTTDPTPASTGKTPGGIYSRGQRGREQYTPPSRAERAGSAAKAGGSAVASGAKTGGSAVASGAKTGGSAVARLGQRFGAALGRGAGRAGAQVGRELGSAAKAGLKAGAGKLQEAATGVKRDPASGSRGAKAGLGFGRALGRVAQAAVGSEPTFGRGGSTSTPSSTSTPKSKVDPTKPVWGGGGVGQNGGGSPSGTSARKPGDPPLGNRTRRTSGQAGPVRYNVSQSGPQGSTSSVDVSYNKMLEMSPDTRIAKSTDIFKRVLTPEAPDETWTGTRKEKPVEISGM